MVFQVRCPGGRMCPELLLHKATRRLSRGLWDGYPGRPRSAGPPPRWGPALFLPLGYPASERSLHSHGAGTSPDLGLRWKPPWQTDLMPNPLIWLLPVIKVGFTSVIIFLFTFSMCSECRWEKQVPFIGDALKNITRNKTSALQDIFHHKCLLTELIMHESSHYSCFDRELEVKCASIREKLSERVHLHHRTFAIKIISCVG